MFLKSKFRGHSASHYIQWAMPPKWHLPSVGFISYLPSELNHAPVWVRSKSRILCDAVFHKKWMLNESQLFFIWSSSLDTPDCSNAKDNVCSCLRARRKRNFSVAKEKGVSKLAFSKGIVKGTSLYIMFTLCTDILTPFLSIIPNPWYAWGQFFRSQRN